MDDTINTSNLERLRLKRRLKAQRRMMRIKADPERYKAYLEKCRNSANKANQKNIMTQKSIENGWKKIGLGHYVFTMNVFV